MKGGRKLLEQDPTLQKIVEVIVEALDPDKIILFGSRAREDYDEDSDYDLLVLKEGVKPEERRRLESSVYVALSRNDIWVGVDLIVQSPDGFERLKEKWFMVYHYAASEGVVLYERGRKKVA